MAKDEQQDEDRSSRPGYDGRLQYHQTLRESMVRIRICMAVQEFGSWFIELNAMYAMTAPYMQKKCKEPIDKLFRRVNNDMVLLDMPFIGATDKVCVRASIANRLNKLTRDIYENSKSLLLPIKDDDEDDTFDKDGFMKGTDL